MLLPAQDVFFLIEHLVEEVTDGSGQSGGLSALINDVRKKTPNKRSHDQKTPSNKNVGHPPT